MRFFLVALIALLVLPAAALGQGQTRGNALANPANATFGCESVPDIAIGFDGVFMNPGLGSASCTWYDAGSTVAAGTIAPGPGVVTKVRVRSGPNPSPLRVAILESLQSRATIEAGGSCCSVERESAVFQPTPNAITVVDVNLPVTPQKTEGLNIVQFVGLSAAADGGTLPVFDPGPAAHTVEAAAFGGAPTNVVFSPALAPNGQAALNGRAAPGWELLMNFDWVPCAGAGGRAVAKAAQACGAGPAPQAPVPPPAVVTPPAVTPPPVSSVSPAAIAGGTLRSGARGVPLRITCSLPTGCEGVLRIMAGRKTLGRRNVTLLASAAKTFRVKLTRAARKRVARRGRLRARAVFELAGGAGRVVQDVVLRG